MSEHTAITLWVLAGNVKHGHPVIGPFISRDEAERYSTECVDDGDCIYRPVRMEAPVLTSDMIVDRHMLTYHVGEEMH